MVRNDPTKRWHGGISARLGLSACILVPPLLMAAGIAFFDAFAPQNGGPQPAVQPPAEQRAAAPQSIVAKTASATERSNAGSSFALANAGMRPLLTEKRPVAEWPLETEPTGAIEQRAAGQAAAATDSAAYYGPVPVTVVHVRKAGGPPELADLDAAAPIVKTPKISRRLPVATRRHAASHARGKIGHHAPPRITHSAKQQRGHPPSHPGQRPSIRQRSQRR
jgi:hypothetical protein